MKLGDHDKTNWPKRDNFQVRAEEFKTALKERKRAKIGAHYEQIRCVDFSKYVSARKKRKLLQ